MAQINSDQNFPVLTTLISEVRVLKDQDVIFVENESTRQSNEVTRQSGETNRNNTFNTSELSRTSTFNNSEASRTTAEGLRVVAEGLREQTTEEIKLAYDNATKANLSLEVSNARNGFANLDARLDSSDSQLANMANEVDTASSKADTASLKADAMASGSPKGVYATLTDLQTAFPTGTTGAYLVTADGHWYYWNGSAWTDGGVYQATGLVDGSVSGDKTDFMKIGKNKFNKTAVTTGKYVNSSTGNLSTNASYTASEFIPILPDNYWALAITDQSAFYDINKTYISGFGILATPKIFKIPPNAYYFRTSTTIANLDLQQLELGSIATAYEAFRYVLSFPSAVDYNELNTAIENTQMGMTTTKSVNLFNKTDVVLGKTISYAGSGINTNALYSYCNFIEIEPNTEYIANLSNASEQVAFYNDSITWVGGLLYPQTAFTTPTTAKYMRVTILIANLDKTIIAKGSVLPNYMPYGKAINSQYVGKPTRVITVAKQGGDYTTISEAVLNANASASRPVTILVYPGVYKESVSIGGGKYISIVGVNKQTCILREDTGVYATAPLEISAPCYVANMTIISTHDDDSVTPINDLYSYAVHCDFLGAGVAEFFNCILISNQHAAIGIGLSQDQTVKLVNCELYSYTPTDSSYKNNGALYCHSRSVVGVTNQKLILINCIIKSEYSFATYFYDAGSGAGMTVSLYNNMFYSNELGKTNIVNITPKTTGNLSGAINLTADSYGNNIDILNA